MWRLTLFLLVPALASCGGSDPSGGGPRIVATTTQVADLARNVAGPRAEVTGLLAPNTDPHEYEVRPRDVKALTTAALVLRSGGDVDAWLDGAMDAAGVDAADVVDLGAAAGMVGDDPHWWQDPRRAERAVAAIRDALTRTDPPGAAAYRAGAARYLARLRALDAAVARCMGAVPPARRLLVTSHDALGYYARRYGIRVVGAVIPALTTAAQPSAGEVARLVATIRRTGVKTIFAESSVNPKVERAIAAAAGARVGTALWADALGPAGSDGATYLQSVRANTRALVSGFTGRPATCPADA